jgi:hypothetical protein
VALLSHIFISGRLDGSASRCPSADVTGAMN